MINDTDLDTHFERLGLIHGSASHDKKVTKKEIKKWTT